ncbi:hypothetical protein ABB37_04451 [Leptomonas pyrrhocoris]|uniref:Uncharacterized protein n=1 Tax=Leptomonas pyrrhocoris TaxID=157538 RepID=A0A0M9G2U2_LEPPY|nr:hypothetical protein ABB37_04451 [Leptomonas pyrrhocoris]KPA81093.1 hypothetical protein ABB37_04451 [Leptomonas pyrrhocoris]|eukprot:XP_015659532.1 hypothetical protein ABB37_04451 [Leptomonas pyrrhocoris]
MAVPQSSRVSEQQLFHGAAAAATATAIEEAEADSVEYLPPCNGADARYIEVANERAFSALQIHSRGANEGRTFFEQPRSELNSPLLAPYQPLLQQQHTRRDNATAATLTPVRTSLSSTPTPPHVHTPLHSTSYGSNYYNRILSNALLGGAEGRTNVYSFPAAFSTPPARVQRARSRSETGEAAAAADDHHGTDERAFAAVPVAQAIQDEFTKESIQSGTVDAFAVHVKQLTYTKCIDEADSSIVSLCSTPHPFTLGDSKEEVEDEDTAEGAPTRARLLRVSEHQPPPRPSGAGGQRRSATSLNGQTPSVTSPVIYFQGAPSMSTAANSSASRLRFQEGVDSAAIFDGVGDTTHPANARQRSRTRHTQPMRTAGVVRHASLSPVMAACPPGHVGSTFSLDLDATSVQGDALLCAPHDRVHLLPRMVHDACIASSPHELSAESHAEPTSPLCLPSSAVRHTGCCTPLTPRPTFVLPPSTTRAAAASGKRRGTGAKGDLHDDDEDNVLGAQRRSGGDSCATPPLSCYTEDSPTPVRSFGRGEDVGQGDVRGLLSTTARALFVEPGQIHSAVGAAERSSGVESGTARCSVRSSSASHGRSMTPSHILTTPVRHYDNSIRDFHSSSSSLRVGGGALPVSFLSVSPTTRLCTSPAGAMTPVSLTPARQTTRSAPSVAVAATAAVTTMSAAAVDGGVAGLEHRLTYRDALLGIPRSIATAHGVALRRGSTSRRDAFHFLRAMTANETSTDLLHNPFYWGCFGFLVAQRDEVWCVGKAQPFRIYPQDADQAARTRDRSTTITVVTSTTLLSAATWEAAALTTEDEASVTVATASPITHGMASSASDLVYLVVGTCVGDVNVYTYGKCSASSPGAVTVSLSSSHDVSPPPHQASTYTVKLRQYGTLRCADRVGGDRPPPNTGETHGSGGRLRSLTPPASTVGDEEAQRHAISVLRVVGPWLYIGDQSGHVSRYDLRCTFFLRALHEAAASTLPSVQLEGARRQPPHADTRSAVEGGSTPARKPVPLNLRMPVHQFTRPSATPPTQAAASKALVSSPADTALRETSPCFHSAVHAGEPVYNLEVTDNHSYLAVGTQTRLLVYRVAEMPRVADAISLPAARQWQKQKNRFTVADALTSTPPSDISEECRAMLETSIEPTAPLVVVSNALQPVRCFAWMLCDYDALIGAHSSRTRGDDSPAAYSMMEGDAYEYDVFGDAAAGASVQMSAACSFSLLSHTPTPTLVFASACYESTDAAAAAREETGSAPQRWKTDIQLYRLVTKSVVASCVLDYPVRVLKVVAGTTQIIAGTGSTTEWQHEPSPSSSSPSLPTALPPGATAQSNNPQTRFMTPTRSPLHHLVYTRSQSATPITPNASLSPTFTRSPVPASLRCRSTPAAAAAMAALRTLTSGESRPSPGLWRTPLPSASSSSSRPPTRSGTTAMWPSSGAGRFTTTPDTGGASRQPRARRAEDHSQHGFLFKFEVCPCAADDAASADSDGCVCLRSRGEIVVGEGESAVSGYLSPTQDQVAVLVQPARSSARRTGGPYAMSVKVKVWGLAPCFADGSSVSSARRVSTTQAATFGSVAPTVESLR